MQKMDILRGLPGSGKTTQAKSLLGQVFSTDDYFIVDGEYKFQPKGIAKAHEWNQARVEKAILEGTDIVVDNTNCSLWEMKPYVKMAVESNLDIRFHTPKTSWAFNVQECAKRNTHGVPEAAIQGMLDRWDDIPYINKILEAKAPWEK